MTADGANEDWSRVRWTQARQVTQMLGWPEAAEGLDPGMAPQAYFAALCSAGRLVEAAQFLALSLPRWEAVAWAARAVRDQRPDDQRLPAETEALKRALLWVQDPSEPRRRAAFQAADQAPVSSPERLAALAAYLSGGSMTPEEVQPIQAPREAAGKLAAAAVLAAVFSGPDPFKALGQHLQEGARLAGGAAS